MEKPLAVFRPGLACKYASQNCLAMFGSHYYCLQGTSENAACCLCVETWEVEVEGLRGKKIQTNVNPENFLR